MQTQSHSIHWPLINFGPVNLWSLPWHPPVVTAPRKLVHAGHVRPSAKQQELAKILTLRG